MNHWPFIIAAYVLTGIATLAVTLWAWLVMRKMEKGTRDL